MTKWVEAEGIPDKSSETVLSVFTKFVTTHGCPSVLITDQGREFCNDLNEKFCKQFGIEHRIASAYHPQTGGHTERFNRTLCDMLVHSVDLSQKNWDIKLPYVLFAYRTSKHESTKQTPFYLVFGRHARLPIELDLAMQSDDNQDSELSLKERIDSFIKLSCNRKEASSNIKTAQSKQKKYYDSSLPKDDTAGFEVGDQVLLHNTRKLTRKGGKLGLKWKGPFKITKVTGKGTYFLEGMKTSVSGNRLNRYRQSNDDAATDNTEKRPTEGPKDDHSLINKETGTQANEKAFERPAKRNDKSDDCNLPPKKRRVSREDVATQPTNSTESTNQEPQPFQFRPSNQEWQEQISSVFKSTVKNTYASGPDKYIRRDAKPTKTVNMRGDGNCLFRTFSYLVFGVQTHHSLIRQAIVDFMKENETLMKGITRDSVSRYLDTSMMASENTWGTEVEIFAFATLTRSVVYVYSQYGSKEQWRWLEYKPLGLIGGNLRGRAVYIQNTSDHFVPVLEVDGEEFSRKPYKRIRNHIPERYHALISDDLLDAALVNCYADEALLLKLDKSVKTVYVKAFTNTPYNVEGLRGLSDEVDANIFNIVCDWSDVENKLN